MKNPEHHEAPKEYRIREATPADAQEIARIQYESWIATYPNEEAGITEEDVRIFLGELKERERRWRKNIENAAGKKIKIFIAEDEGKIIGFCKVTQGEIEDHVDGLYIDLVYKGKKLGSRLAREVSKFFGETKPVVLEVAAYNETAIKIYERYGFQEIRRENHPRAINDKAMPLIVMRRPARNA